jgi:hypothetical protein
MDDSVGSPSVVELTVTPAATPKCIVIMSPVEEEQTTKVSVVHVVASHAVPPTHDVAV